MIRIQRSKPVFWFALACALPACGGDDGAQPEPSQDSGAPDSAIDGGAPQLDGSTVIDAATPDAFVGDAGSACPAQALVPTVHGGDIMQSETWTAAGSPHVISEDVWIQNAAKLTIEPCAVVRFAEDTGIMVPSGGLPGAITANGTPTQPIRFEGLDGARWGQIDVRAPATASFKYTTIAGGGGNGSYTKSGASLFIEGDGVLPSKVQLTVDHLTVTGSVGAGVKLVQAAKFSADSHDLTITNSGNADFPYPLEVGEQTIDSIPAGAYSGNRVDEILIQPEVVSGATGVQEDATMHERGVPYQVGTDAQFDDLTVGAPNHAPTVTLTIEPGVTLKFLPGTSLDVTTRNVDPEPTSGALRAVGTADKPIVFTSSQPSPKAGDWRGIWYNGHPAASNRLDYVHIEYTGAACRCVLVTCTQGVTAYEGAVIFLEEPQSAFMTHSVITHGTGHGVVQGWHGPSLDWSASNTFSDLGGCRTTEPVDEGGHCPSMPACVK